MGYDLYGNPLEPVTRVASTYLTDPQAAVICDTFAQGLDSGLSYAKVLSFLERKGLADEAMGRLRHGLMEEGLGLSDTFAKYGFLDESARKLLRVAEVQGEVPATFKAQAALYRQRFARKNEVLGAFYEPALLFFLAFGVAIPLLSNLVALSQATSMVQAALSLLVVPLALTLVVLVVGALAAAAWLRLPVDFSWREVGFSVWMRLPVVSDPSRLNSVHLFCYYLATSLRSGMSIMDCLTLSVEACNDPRMGARVDRVLMALQEGHTLCEACATLPQLPSDVLDYLDLGEETGRLEEMLLQASKLYEERAQETFQKYMKGFSYLMRIGLMTVVFATLMFSVFQLAKGFKL